MSFTYDQKVGNHVYVYDIQSYWDKEKKAPRQQRVYLGKRDPTTGKVISTRKAYTSLDYGNVYFLGCVTQQLGLQEILKRIFPGIWRDLLACMFFQISEKKALYLCKPWLECTSLETDTKLSSQRISDLLRELGRRDADRLEFLRTWGAKHKKNRFIVFDITSFSSYSKQLEFVEWGYNRDKEKLPQVNLGVIFGEPCSGPLFYSIYPGSIPDVRTMENMVEYLDWLDLGKSLFVMDKGFYSSHNLKKMAGGELKFLIPLSNSNKNASALIEKHIGGIAHHSHSFQLSKQVLYCITDKVEIAGDSYHAYVYLDEQKRVEEKDRFLKKILEVEEKARELNFKGKEELKTFLSENVKGWQKYLRVSERSGFAKPARKSKEISVKLERMGIFTLLSNKRINKQEALSIYRRKDVIEKFFDTMKNDIDRKRLRVHEQLAFEGRLFLDFLTLIVYSKITKVMQDSRLNKTYTVQEMMYELKKIRLIRLGEKKTIISEVSKKQRQLFEKFNHKPPAAT